MENNVEKQQNYINFALFIQIFLFFDVFVDASQQLNCRKKWTIKNICVNNEQVMEK